MTNEVKTASGTQISNDLINQVLAETEAPKVEATVVPPSDNLVTLPGGYINAAGEVIKTVEVRELNGKDEEFIGKAQSLAKAFGTILSRATVKVGNEAVTEDILDRMLSGDRDAIMLGICKATYGPEMEILGVCDGCGDFQTVGINIDRDISTKILVDPIQDRTFTIEGKSGSYLVTLPNGVVQRELATAEGKNFAELTTILLEKTVLEINDNPVISKLQIQNLGVVDRKKIGDELAKRTPGPEFKNIEVDCPDCDGKVVVPISLGALFRF